jgi:hypothetical protein
MPHPSHLPLFDHHNNVWLGAQILIMKSFPASCYFLTGPYHVLEHTRCSLVIPLMQGTKLIPSASMIKSHFKTHEIVFGTLVYSEVHIHFLQLCMFRSKY